MKENYCSYVEKGLRLKIYDINNEIYVQAKPCCHITYDMIPKDISLPIKLESIDNIMEISPLKYYKKYFEDNNDLHPSCIACTNDESKNVLSPRLKINETDFNDYDINKLDVVLGNSCNLACPFCSSYSSSLIDKLSNSLGIDNRPESWQPLTNKLSAGSSKTPDVIAKILQTHKVHTLKLIGGEPFLKENWDKIADVIDQGYCKDLHLEVTTNGTIINDEIFSRLRKTKSVHLRISIDSIEKNYEFIRWPHSWKKMNKNLNYLKNNNKENIRVSVTNLVNIFNFEFLPNIEEYFQDVKDFVGYSTEIKPLTHLMNYQNLPKYIIDDVKNKIKSTNLKNRISYSPTQYTKEQLRREFVVLLNQRNMKASDVIGPMTREYFEL